MYAEAELSDSERAALIRRGFPRQDLIEWFDGRGAGMLAPQDYFPELLRRVAAETHLRWAQDQEILCGDAEFQARAECIVAPSTTNTTHWILDRAGVLPLPLHSPPPHLIGLIFAHIETLAQFASYDAVIAANAYNSTRIITMSEPVFRHYLAVNAAVRWPANSFEIYAGTLLNWGRRGLFVLCRSNLSALPAKQ